MRKRPSTAPTARTRRARAAVRGALQLPAQCTLASADDLKGRLVELVRSVKTVTINAHAVERIDAASLQLLAAFCRDRTSSGLPVRIETASANFIEAQQLLGLTAIFAPPTHSSDAGGER
jgi:ABC-type transporter Mla MlaB component